MQIAPTIIDKLLAITARLDECGIPHALGGAVALQFYGSPRQTMHIDLNVYLHEEHSEAATDCLAPPGRCLH